MPLLPPLHRTVLATVLAVLAALAIVAHPPAAAAAAGVSDDQPAMAEKVANKALRP